MSFNISGTFSRKRIIQNIQKTSRKRTLSNSKESEEVQSRNISYLANNVVRYMVIVGGSNIPIKRVDIIKNCFPRNVASQASAVFKKAEVILKDVYGYELLGCDSKSAKMYILKNSLKNVEEETWQEIPLDHDKVLKFLILSHIFMCGESSTDSSLFTFLQCCKIDPNVLHPIYGNIMDFLNNKMTREKLVTMHVHDESRKVSYSWGPNADLTASKMEILKFIASFGNKNVKSWRVQYEDAMEQLDDGKNNTAKDNTQAE